MPHLRKKNPYPRHISVRIAITLGITMLIIQLISVILNLVLYGGITAQNLFSEASGVLQTVEDMANRDILIESASLGEETPEFVLLSHNMSLMIEHFPKYFADFFILYGNSDDGYRYLIDFNTDGTKGEFLSEASDIDPARASNAIENFDKNSVLFPGQNKPFLILDNDDRLDWTKENSNIFSFAILLDLTEPGDDNALILCTTVTYDELFKRIFFFQRIALYIALVLAAIASIFMILHVNRKTASPLKKIARASRDFNLQTKNDLSPEQWTYNAPKIQSKDEVQALADSVESMADEMKQAVTGLLEATREKQRISTEMDLAARIQESMLPDHFPAFPDHQDFDIYASMKPAREVGGDFYNFFLTDEDHLCLVIADVSGKGVPAALFMAAAMNTITNICIRTESPAEILAQTNASIVSNNGAEMFVTVWIGILDLSTGLLRAANAGHEYPTICPAGGDFQLYKDKHGFVIGELPGMKYREYEIQMNKGDTLFVYTDGLPEAQSDNENMFGTDRMLEALNRYADRSPEEILHQVEREVGVFVQDAPPFDDLTMLCVRYLGRDT